MAEMEEAKADETNAAMAQAMAQPAAQAVAQAAQPAMEQAITEAPAENAELAMQMMQGMQGQ